MNDVTKQVQDKLAKTGSIGQADFAVFQQDNEPKKSVEPDGSTKVSVPQQAMDDPHLGIAEGETAGDQIKKTAEIEDPSGFEFGVNNLVEISVTPTEKNTFLDSLIGNTRFELPFSLFGGKLKGTLRSRTSGESRAIMMELHRQWTLVKFMPVTEYATMMKSALLRCQLKELNGVEYPELQEPLLAQGNLKDKDQPAVIAPAWVDEMDVLCNSMSDGMITNLYQEVQKFEQKYWTLVAHSDDQDFWNPEDSTSV